MPLLGSLAQSAYSLAALCALGLSAYGVGREFHRRLRLPDDDRTLVTTWSLSLGLLAAATLLMLLAAAGWLTTTVIALGTLAGCGWGGLELTCELLKHRQGRIVSGESAIAELLAPSAHSPLSRFALALIVVVLGAKFVSALAPPTASEVQARSLLVPKNLLTAQELAREEVAAEHAVPRANLVQMLYLWALALDGPVAANLVQWGLGVLFAAAVGMLARPIVGDVGTWMAAAVSLLCPGVQSQLALPTEGLALGLFSTLAIAGMLGVLIHGGSARWVRATGLVLGAAIACDPAGLPLAIAVGVIWFRSPAQTMDPLPKRALWRDLVLNAAAVAVPWWLFTRYPLEVGHWQPLQAVASQLGPLLLLALGVLLVRLPTPAIAWTATALAYLGWLCAVGWPGQWAASFIAVGAVAAAWAFQELVRLPKLQSGLIATSLALLALGLAWPAVEASLPAWPVVCGLQTREDYLLANSPSYRAASLLNRIALPGERLLSEDPRCVYFACPSAAPATAPASERGPSPLELSRWARSAGFTYVLLSRELGLAGDADPSAASSPGERASRERAAEDFSACGEFLPILEYRVADSNNRCIRYSLLRIR